MYVPARVISPCAPLTGLIDEESQLRRITRARRVYDGGEAAHTLQTQSQPRPGEDETGA